jgi:hypothetical protein
MSGKKFSHACARVTLSFFSDLVTRAHAWEFFFAGERSAPQTASLSDPTSPDAEMKVRPPYPPRQKRPLSRPCSTTWR